MLDYSQRLRDHSRAALASETLSTGRRMFEAALAGGARAAHRQSGAIKAGHWADLLGLDGDHVDLCARKGDAILDSFVFAGGDTMVKNVWAAGRHLVVDGKHVAQTAIKAAYTQTLTKLTDTL